MKPITIQKNIIKLIFNLLSPIIELMIKLFINSKIPTIISIGTHDEKSKDEAIPYKTKTMQRPEIRIEVSFFIIATFCLLKASNKTLKNQ